MLLMELTRAPISYEAAVAPGNTIVAEGLALVRTNTAQSAGVLPSTGGSSDVFVGFSIAGTSAAPFPLQYATKVEEFVAPVSGAVELGRAPVSGQAFLWNVTTAAAVTIGGGGSNATLSGRALGNLTSGNVYRITYRFSLTVTEARSIQGDIQPGGYIGDYVGQIGVLANGIVYTSEFDASKNWAAATGVKLSANGQVTDQSGAGNLIPAQIVAAPGVDYPFLGLRVTL